MAWEMAPPTWEAVAMLVTGIAAVGGAALVGRHQTVIQREQVAIQIRLAEIEHLKVKLDLFERRRAIFESTEQYLIAVIFHSASPFDFLPDKDGELVGDKAVVDRFMRSKDQCRFLFRRNVYDDIACIHQMTIELEGLRKDDGGLGVESKVYLKTKRRLLDALNNLSNVFGDELSLGDPGLRSRFLNPFGDRMISSG